MCRPAPATSRRRSMRAHDLRRPARAGRRRAAQPGVAGARLLGAGVGAGAAPTGRPAIFPHTVTDRAKPGLIAVNRDGRRFVNEARVVPRVRAGAAARRRSATFRPGWSATAASCGSTASAGCGRSRCRRRRERASGYLHRGRTLAELAGEIGVPAAGVRRHRRHFNADAQRGVDPQFGRGGDIYQRHLGDARAAAQPVRGAAR